MNHLYALGGILAASLVACVAFAALGMADEATAAAGVAVLALTSAMHFVAQSPIAGEGPADHDPT